MYYPIVKVQLYGDDDKFSIKDLVSFFKVEWTIVDENSKEVKKENLAHFEKYLNILVRKSRLSGFIRATVPIIGSHQKCYAAKGSLHE